MQDPLFGVYDTLSLKASVCGGQAADRFIFLVVRMFDLNLVSVLRATC